MLTPVLPPSEAAITRSGSIWARAPNTVSTMRNPVSPRAAQAAGGTALAIVPGGAVEAGVAEDLVRQDRLETRVRRGAGERQRVVDGALHLGRGAGPVRRHLIAVFLQGHRERDRRAEVDAVVVDPVSEAPFTVRYLRA